MVRHQPNVSFTRVANPARPCGRRTEQAWPLCPIAAITPSSAFTQTTRRRLSIWRLRLQETPARAGRRTESASHLCGGPETAALRNRFSNNVRKHGPSGQPMRPPAKGSNYGRAHLRCAALRRALRVGRICTGRQPAVSFSCRISTAGHISIRFQKPAVSRCC